MQAQIIKTTVEIDSGLFYLAKMKALQDGKSLKYIINQSLSQLLNQSQTVDLLASIQKIVEESGVTEDELQKSGRNIRKQLVKKHYQ
ncbi:hypothetical protein CO051_03335 [Candidatus Roizmanbacteria bacterium CG_4_9_14_0_2_um_filter_39_13]|uniref:Uncharacterized protein n=1 Tax=Candidatus Roizmanbacteria bacterium CG_4_9_14_0_2_um_filter_39_13 TaxID=1974839 RepID=A0A2M8EZE5_9BACT|nr:MAG: hypothetical protein CO051_03335 [Candidatus Roizmanbacteria bacterium CG_4_9_14_0_2_um_filter_39_13]